MPWADWICCLWVSLELDEIERYERYIYAGGKPEKWQWTYRHLETRHGENIAGSIIAQYEAMAADALSKGRIPDTVLLRGSIEEAADRGFVQRGYTSDDGRFFDEFGNEIKLPPGTFFRAKRATD